MISHKYKCIFIHVSKCAGSSIETAFGIDISNISEENNKRLFGWNKEHKIFLQHATPQELLDFGLINKETWNSYYKFIVIRNPWDRALSDYLWLSREKNIEDSFENFVKRKGGFRKYLENREMHIYRGDHLTPQANYFYLDQKRLQYDKVIRFENLNKSLSEVAKDLGLTSSFFSKKVNVGNKSFPHYSKFYSPKRKRLIEEEYQKDIELLDYSFEDHRNFMDYFSFLKASNQLIK